MDLTSPKTIKELCLKFDFAFSKGLGQNFLTDKTVLEKIVKSAQSPNVLEIGPGFGVLTYELAKNCEKVVSVEIDKRLEDVLSYTLSSFDNVNLIWGDVLKLDLRQILSQEFEDGEISVAANLPYYITTPIIAKLLEEKLPLKNIIVMVQKEVAQRICASPGNKDYGAISVLCQFYSVPEIITNVAAHAFVPPPKVDSAVLKLNIKNKPNVMVNDEDLFFKVVKFSFSQRRKTLTNCLSNGFKIPKNKIIELLTMCELEPNIRGERLSIEQFAKISDKLGEILL